MYLKKIISNGFKSFADKITITLDKTHITGIVGPNGSGKSNVIDAVRWVMGEQNAKMLRGEKATDIIFSGSEKRKPLGMAEVTLVFDNTEGSPLCPTEYRHEPEIALTRRLYIDGQREYLINKKPSRLKDIVSFFSSTGLGGRSYSMIQQGQVDRILQAKPEEIREILEEAAGISIFKQRRNEARKKLDKTQVNLSRIDDILIEIARQKETLGEQVEKAQRYQDLNTRLRDSELGLFAHNFLLFTRKAIEIKQVIEDSSLKDVACAEEISNLEQRYHDLKDKLNEADPELTALSEEITVLREKIASTEASLLSYRQLQESGDSQLAAYDLDLNEQEQTLQTNLADLEAIEQKLELASSQALDLEEMSTSLSERAELGEEEAQVFENKIRDLQHESQNLSRFLDTNKIRRENIEAEFSKSTKAMHEYTAKVLRIEEDYSQAQILYEGLRIKQSQQQKGLESELDKKNLLELKIKENQNQLTEEKNRFDYERGLVLEDTATLRSLAEPYKNADDILAAIKSLPESDLRDFKILLLTDQIAFADSFSDFSTEIKRSFEKWAERLIILSFDHLRSTSVMLTSRAIKGVKASLNQTSATKENDSKWQSKWHLHSMLDYLDILPGSFFQASKEILSSVYILERSFPEEEMLATMPHGTTLISGDGSVYTQGGDLRIGSSETEGALSRKEKYNHLNIKVTSAQQQLNIWQIDIAKKETTISDDSETLNDLNNYIFSKNKDLLELSSQVKNEENRLNIQSEQIESARNEHRTLEERCESLGGEIEELNESDETLSSERSQTQLAIEDALQDSEQLNETKQELRRQVEQSRIDHASINAKAQTLAEHFERDKFNAENLRSRLSKKRLERQSLEEKLSESHTRQKELTADIESYIYRREDLEDLLQGKKQVNAGLIEDLQVVEDRIREARDLSAKAQKSVSEKELELERVRIGIEGSTAGAEEKYHIDLEQYEFEEIENFDANAQSREISGIRSKLESMGLINMMAIEEFRELSERQEFMISQKNEVDSSIDLLELAIEEIEEKSKNTFMETFSTLNKEFSILFPILFPRGEAQIQLTDEENPLESGVEIMVRLPGKNRQNMRLFSGGEKALTAIALIFALLKSKPTPFCFLDEVDAPLDETNVSRYNKVLETLGDRFQFIVITHRRRTMEVLDTLYGVTMQEPGVSKVVGVDMSKALPSHLQKAFKEEKRQGASASFS